MFVPKIGHESDLENALIRASELVRVLPGNQLYMVSRVDGKLAVTEAWDTREQQQASLQNAEVRALIGSAMPFIDDKPGYTHLEIIAGI